MRRYVTVQKYGQTFKLIYRTNLGGKKNGQLCDEDIRDEDRDLYGEGEQEDRERPDRVACNIARARSRVRELALCNPWDYFVTFTLSPDKADRFDLRGYVKRFGEFVGNYRRVRARSGFRYIFIPEQHKNGAWHAHGLVRGIPPRDLVRNANGYLDWPAYGTRFGYVSLDAIRDPVKVCAYITKYISKSFGATTRAPGEHLFYASQGLNEKRTVCTVSSSGVAEYEGEHCGITWVTDSDGVLYDLLQNLADGVGNLAATSEAVGVLLESYAGAQG